MKNCITETTILLNKGVEKYSLFLHEVLPFYLGWKLLHVEKLF